MSKTNLSQPVRNCLGIVRVTIHDDQRVDDAVRSLRIRQIEEKSLHYITVVDKKNRLKGVVSARTLLLSPPFKMICQIMDSDLVTVGENETLGKSLELLHEHKLLSLPVVDEEGRLLGAIDVNNYIPESAEMVNKRFSHDLFTLFGVTIEEGKKGGAFKRFTIRLPWIFCNMIGGIFCAIISRFYEAVLAQMLVLAMFIPLVLTLSESISMQSMTQSLQQLRKEPTKLRKIFSLCFTEWKTISLLSVTCGILVGAISLLWGDGPQVGITIGVGLITGIFISAVIGSAIPYILHAKKLDPKVAAGPIVLMFADVITTTIYLGFATYRLL